MNLISKCIASIKDRKLPSLKLSSRSKNKPDPSREEVDISYRDVDNESIRARAKTEFVDDIPDVDMLDEYFVCKHRGGISLGEYDMLITLGAGKQGRVMLGWNTRGKEFVALKVIDTDLLNPGHKKLIDNEIYALRTMSHPNILQLKEVFYDVLPTSNLIGSTKATIMVLDFCSGGDLFRILHHTGGLPEPLARTYFMQLVSAISACHEVGIYHRDIKPQNILLDYNFQIKIADFGVCAVTPQGDKDICTMLCGTPSYMPPEIIARQPYSGEKADAWSLGIVLFNLLSGRPPLKVATDEDWWFRMIRARRMDKFWHAHGKFSPNIFPKAKVVLNCLLVANPNERCTVTNLLANPWLEEPAVSLTKLKVEMSKRFRMAKAIQDSTQAGHVPIVSDSC